MKRKGGLSSAVRLRVLKRDRFQCAYCGVAGTQAELEVDRIVAVAKGGSHHMSNLTTACRACNQKKSDGAPLARSNGLIGLFVHTFKDGEIECQGEIIAVDGELALVQWFEWLCGSPSSVGPLAKSIIYSECKLYASAALMNRAYDEECRKLRYRSGGVQVADSGI